MQNGKISLKIFLKPKIYMLINLTDLNLIKIMYKCSNTILDIDKMFFSYSTNVLYCLKSCVCFYVLQLIYCEL